MPETHPKDTDECVERRVRLLVEDGATAACVAVSKTESKNALEMLARALLAFTEIPELRGQILSEGGAKVHCFVFDEGRLAQSFFIKIFERCLSYPFVRQKNARFLIIFYI